MLPSNWKGPDANGVVQSATNALYYLEEWKTKGVVGITGWKPLFDKYGDELLHINEDTYKKRFKSVYERSANHLVRYFIFNMSIGDIILLNEGQQRIVAAGTISSGVRWDKSLPYPAYREVSWYPASLSIPITENKGAFSSPVVRLMPKPNEILIEEVNNALGI